MKTLSATIIAEPWIDMILDGYKTWEIRSKNTLKRDIIGLIRKGSKTVVATAKISDVIKITPSIARANAKHMGFSIKDALTCVGYNAWVLEDIVELKRPVPYEHTNQVTWVTLDESTTKKVLAEAKRSAK